MVSGLEGQVVRGPGVRLELERMEKHHNRRVFFGKGHIHIDGVFRDLCNTAQVDLETIDPDPSDDEGSGRPQQRARSVEDAGMGDMLRHDAERLRILVERHKLHTGSKRAAELLDNWDEALTKFVKVMPRDYARALRQLEAERDEATSVAAE